MSVLNDVDPDKVNFIPVGQYTHDYKALLLRIKSETRCSACVFHDNSIAAEPCCVQWEYGHSKERASS